MEDHYMACSICCWTSPIFSSLLHIIPTQTRALLDLLVMLFTFLLIASSIILHVFAVYQIPYYVAINTSNLTLLNSASKLSHTRNACVNDLLPHLSLSMELIMYL